MFNENNATGHLYNSVLNKRYYLSYMSKMYNNTIIENLPVDADIVMKKISLIPIYGIFKYLNTQQESLMFKYMFEKTYTIFLSKRLNKTLSYDTLMEDENQTVFEINNIVMDDEILNDIIENIGDYVDIFSNYVFNTLQNEFTDGVLFGGWTEEPFNVNTIGIFDIYLVEV